MLGWPELTAAALHRRGDLRVRAIDAQGDGSAPSPACSGELGLDAVEVPEAGLGAAVADADAVVIEALAMGPDGLVAVAGSRAAAAVAHHAGLPVWAVVGEGRVLPDRLWRALLGRLDGRGDPWDADEEIVPLDLPRPGRRPVGHRHPGRRRGPHRLPDRGGAVQRRVRPRHLPGQGRHETPLRRSCEAQPCGPARNASKQWPTRRPGARNGAWGPEKITGSARDRRRHDAIRPLERSLISHGVSARTRALPRRSCLSVPGSSERFLAKGPTVPADMTFLDLEDSVAPLEKEAARAKVVDAIKNLDWGDRVLCVRVNAWDSKWTAYDVIEVVGSAGDRLDEVMLPKVQSAAEVVALDLLLDPGRGPRRACRSGTSGSKPRSRRPVA